MCACMQAAQGGADPAVSHGGDTCAGSTAARRLAVPMPTGAPQQRRAAQRPASTSQLLQLLAAAPSASMPCHQAAQDAASQAPPPQHGGGGGGGGLAAPCTQALQNETPSTQALLLLDACSKSALRQLLSMSASTEDSVLWCMPVGPEAAADGCTHEAGRAAHPRPGCAARRGYAFASHAATPGAGACLQDDVRPGRGPMAHAPPPATRSAASVLQAADRSAHGRDGVEGCSGADVATWAPSEPLGGMHCCLTRGSLGPTLRRVAADLTKPPFGGLLLPVEAPHEFSASRSAHRWRAQAPPHVNACSGGTAHSADADVMRRPTAGALRFLLATQPALSLA